MYSEHCLYSPSLHDCFSLVFLRIFGCFAQIASTLVSVRFVSAAIASVLLKICGVLMVDFFKKLNTLSLSFVFFIWFHRHVDMPITAATIRPEIKLLLDTNSRNSFIFISAITFIFRSCADSIFAFFYKAVQITDSTQDSARPRWLIRTQSQHAQ